MVKQGMYCKSQKSSIRICHIYIMHELSVCIMSINRLRRTFPNPYKKGGSMGVGLGIHSMLQKPITKNAMSMVQGMKNPRLLGW